MAGIAGKARLAFLLSLVFCGAVLAASFTTDDVIQMAKSGQPEQAILDAIHTSHATFYLTANDVADLRQAGVSLNVIYAMIDTGVSTAPASPPAAEASDQETSKSSAGIAQPSTPATVMEYVPQPPVDYPPPGYYGYPFYPVYAPAYYPVFDPFFAGFFGPWFSFGFVSSFGFHTIFPCHNSFVVVGHGCDFQRFRNGAFVGTHANVFSTRRGYSSAGQTGIGGWRAPVSGGHPSIGKVGPRGGAMGPGSSHRVGSGFRGHAWGGGFHGGGGSHGGGGGHGHGGHR